jgi:hypothetical protein
MPGCAGGQVVSSAQASGNLVHEITRFPYRVAETTISGAPAMGKKDEMASSEPEKLEKS